MLSGQHPEPHTGSYGSPTERRSLMKQTVALKLRAAFRSEIEQFLSFIEKTSKQPGGTGIREGIVDNPFWDAWNQWKGRMIGMERLLLTAGVRRATIEREKLVLPEKLRSFTINHLA